MEDLRFVDCHDDRSGVCLQSLLIEVNALKRFVFVTNHSSIFEGLEEHRRPSARGMARGLIRHMAHLEDLVISPSDGTYGGDLSREWFFEHCFRNLRRVAIPHCLFEQDIARRCQYLLPRTLEELQIQFHISFRGTIRLEHFDVAEESSAAAVKWLTKAKLSSLPQLRRVFWWFQPHEQDKQVLSVGTKVDAYCGSLSELQRRFWQLGDTEVEFEWVSSQLFDKTPLGKRLNAQVE